MEVVMALKDYFESTKGKGILCIPFCPILDEKMAEIMVILTFLMKRWIGMLLPKLLEKFWMVDRIWVFWYLKTRLERIYGHRGLMS
jgi:hypothetical protein